MKFLYPSKAGVIALPRQRGLTLVELMVAMVIGLLITLAAISALVVTEKGFSTVDASSQLRDNGRFAADLIQRLGVQSGFKDYFYAAKPPTSSEIAANFPPNITGFNNALLDASSPLSSPIPRTVGLAGYGSDILILRYQAAETVPGSGVSDNSMIDCAGNPVASTPLTRADRMVSILYVDESPTGSGELALMCTHSVADIPLTVPPTFHWETQPIVANVENFQVLYGTDGVVPGAAPTAAATSVPDGYLRADQMTVAGNAVATNANWRRVRSIRIGMVLRGPINSAQDRVTRTLYPFGMGRASSSGASGSAMSSTGDEGTVFTPPVDGRLRQVVTFTVHLRNNQEL